ncbi:unnamed protein product, partial [Ixodes persulcatus]
IDRNCTTLFPLGFNCQAILIVQSHVSSFLRELNNCIIFINYILYTLVNTNSLFCYDTQ